MTLDRAAARAMTKEHIDKLVEAASDERYTMDEEEARMLAAWVRDELDAKDAEIERLREALRFIAYDHDHCGPDSVIAEQALGGWQLPPRTKEGE